MTTATMALAELAEKGADVDVLRQMVQFTAQRCIDPQVACSYVITSGVAAPPPPPPPPAPAPIPCANEGSVCILPAGITATVSYGANLKFFSKTGVTGSIGCNNATFGDPISGIVKSCGYVGTSRT